MLRSSVLAACLPSLAIAQAPPDAGKQEAFADMQRLMSVEVSIASRRLQSQDQAPSIVSVVTRADIERYGWRELTDILRALPGFDFACDGTGLIGLSERGIWAHEGKALVMVDGISVSPLHNGNLNYYGYLPSELIERVEIIRGPGSAIYGQFAGAAVINVLTRRAQDPMGGRFALRGSSLGAGDGGGGGYLTANGQFANSVALSVSLGYQTSPFSRQPYVDTFFTGNSFEQAKGNTRRETSYFAAEVRALGAEIHVHRSTFQLAQVDGDGRGPLDPAIPGLPEGIPGSGTRAIQGLRVLRSFSLAKDLSVEASIEELQNNMGVIYAQSQVGAGVFTSGSERSRFTGDLCLRWDAPSNANLLVGGGYIRDWERSVDLQNQGGLRDPNDPNLRLAQQTLQNRYAYLQYAQQIKGFGLTAGARYEHSGLNHAFAPRLGLTYSEGALSAKLLYGEAFRAPTLFQTYSALFAFRGFLKPELIRSTELELGWQVTPHVLSRVNLYRIAITRAISSGLDRGTYYIQNAGSNHSKGIEASLDARFLDWGGFANLSYTKPDGAVDAFFLNSGRTNFLGVSPLKVNLGAYASLGPIQVAPSLLYASARDAQTPRSAQSGLQADQFLPNLIESQQEPARLILNLALTWKEVLGRNTEARVSVTNLTNAKYPLIQPYYGFHAPLPANDRRFTADLVWRF